MGGKPACDGSGRASWRKSVLPQTPHLDPLKTAGLGTRRRRKRKPAAGRRGSEGRGMTPPVSRVPRNQGAMLCVGHQVQEHSLWKPLEQNRSLTIDCRSGGCMIWGRFFNTEPSFPPGKMGSFMLPSPRIGLVECHCSFSYLLSRVCSLCSRRGRFCPASHTLNR